MTKPAEARRAFGEDRLDSGAPGWIWLHCPVPKTWLPRRTRTLTSAEYPGTAVEWQGEIFEVVHSEPQADGAVRYRLAPWPEAHAIRRMERYDAESEAARGAERLDRRERLFRRRMAFVLAPFAGLLPGEVQSRMAAEYEAPALLMTLSSAVPLFFLGGMLVVYCVARAVAGSAPVWLLFLSAYVFGESIARIASVVLAGEPMGSLPVAVAYEIWRQSGASSAKKTRRVVPVSETDVFDRFLLLEPLLSLLDPAEQEQLAERFWFDPIRWGKITAVVLLIVGGLEAMASLATLALGYLGFRDGAWLVAGAFLVYEQIGRWRILAAGSPAGSVLGALVRPLARPLLAER